MKKFKKITLIFIIIVFSILLNGCFNHDKYSEVSEVKNEIIRIKKEELTEQMLLMHTSLINENLVPNSFNINLDRKIQEISNVKYVAVHPATRVDFSLVGYNYYLPEYMNYRISWGIDANNIIYAYELDFKNCVITKNLTICESKLQNIGDFNSIYEKYEKEIIFYKNYYSIERDLIDDIYNNFDYDYLITDFEKNNVSVDELSNGVSKKVILFKSNDSRIVFHYNIYQNKEDLTYDFGITISLVEKIGEL